MSLTGNLRTMSLPDILQWIAMGRKTGTLHLDHSSIQKRIMFRDGHIATSWSNDPRESLGQFLIREALVSEEQLFKALVRQEEQGKLLGVLLIEEGALDADALRRVLRRKAEETIYDLFLWSEGQFDFKEGAFPHPTAINIEIGVTEVVMEGIRRIDEWQRIREVFPSSGVTFAVVSEPAAGPADAKEKQILSLVRANKPLAAIALETRRSEFDAAALLYELCERGVIAVAQAPTANPLADTVGAIRDLLSIAHQRLQEKRYDAAMKAYENVLNLDRLNQHAKKGLLGVAEARSRDRARRSVALDKIPVLKIGLQALTGQHFDPHEGFLLSRINGEWDVQSILKICPMAEEEALLIFSRLLDRKVIELR
jgi:Domain of unknown function (DUF4388)